MIQKETYNQEIHDLMWEVFLKEVAPYYSKEGISTFKATIDEYDYLSEMRFYTYREESLLGVIGTDEDNTHISFFFVKKPGQGIGKALLDHVMKDNDEKRISVNAAKNAYEIYHHLGFEDVDEEREQDGIISKEMVYVPRCSWVPLDDPLYVAYHDEEWGKPTHDEQKLYEMFVLELFQAGLSWRIILHKRENFREAYDHFDLDRVCLYDETKIDALCHNPGIIRSRAKIKASISNSRIFREIQKEYGSFDAYIWHFTNGQVITCDPHITKNALSDEVSADLKKRGVKYAGSVTIYSYLQAIGVINAHEHNCFQYKK